eukprot:scaffold217854_cov35-Tisochrysis_lutea.AAC.2
MQAAAIGATSGSGLNALAVTKSTLQKLERANSCTLAVIGLYSGRDSELPACSRNRVFRDFDSSAYTGMSGLTEAINREGKPEPEPRSSTPDVAVASSEMMSPRVTESATWKGRWV